jgi:yopX protein|nr:MAG TPA: YopX protein [Caudoviricetes sp.]
MRDILFRGRDYHGNWRYGNLCHYIDDTGPSWLKNKEFYVIREREVDIDERAFVVIPETIGQLVWKSSDGSHEVWEGDIIECRLFRCFPSSICMAVWDTNTLSFRLRWPGQIQYRSKYSFVDFLGDLFAGGEGVVIGNIHDNPRLFNEEKKKSEGFKETES